MGLDQFAYAVDPKHITSPVDFALTEEQQASREDIAYWRKHPNLQGWMQRLYKQKGGIDPDFNCSPVQLTLEDLARLEADVVGDTLPPTGGFFFGRSTPEDKAEDLTFISAARLAIASGKAVYYTSWW